MSQTLVTALRDVQHARLIPATLAAGYRCRIQRLHIDLITHCMGFLDGHEALLYCTTSSRNYALLNNERYCRQLYRQLFGPFTRRTLAMFGLSSESNWRDRCRVARTTERNWAEDRKRQLILPVEKAQFGIPSKMTLEYDVLDIVGLDRALPIDTEDVDVAHYVKQTAISLPEAKRLPISTWSIFNRQLSCGGWLVASEQGVCIRTAAGKCVLAARPGDDFNGGMVMDGFQPLVALCFQQGNRYVIKVYDSSDGELVHAHEHSVARYTIVLSDGTLFVGQGMNTLRSYNARSGKLLATWQCDEYFETFDVTFSTVIVQFNDERLTVLSLPDLKLLSEQVDRTELSVKEGRTVFFEMEDGLMGRVCGRRVVRTGYRLSTTCNTAFAVRFDETQTMLIVNDYRPQECCRSLISATPRDAKRFRIERDPSSSMWRQIGRESIRREFDARGTQLETVADGNGNVDSTTTVPTQ